jgi:hypothetical protein
MECGLTTCGSAAGALPTGKARPWAQPVRRRRTNQRHAPAPASCSRGLGRYFCLLEGVSGEEIHLAPDLGTATAL